MTLSIKHNWKKAELKELVFFQRGFDITKSQQKEGCVPVVSSSGVNSFHSEAKVDGPGVVIGRKGSLGTVHYIDSAYWPHDTTLWSKSFNGNLPRFVYYYIRTLGLERFDVGNSNPTLNRNHIHRLPVLIPDYNVQKRIASTLSAYDDLIENNRRRIHLLEESARLLYKEWFVHLRFPGHENTKITNGIPEGWEKKELSKIFNTQYGFTESATELPIGPKFLRGTDINKTTYIDWSQVPFCSDDKLDLPKYKLKVDDIVVIRMADPGKVAIIETDVTAVFASYLIRLTRKLNIDIPALFLFYVLAGEHYQSFISGASGGATRKSANAKLVVNFHILVPPKTILQLFTSLVLPIRQQIQNFLQENSKLNKARDLLLPRLMNGELEV